jgi:hypothetical protein
MVLDDLAEIGPEINFPECAQVDIPLSVTDKTSLEEELGISSLGMAEITADLDSYVVLGMDFNHVIDACTPECSTVTFPNLVSRTSTNTSSRFKVEHHDMERPRFLGKENHKSHPLEMFPNIPLCKVDLNTGVTSHMFLVILGCTDVRSKNYFSKLQTAVFTSALNYAKGRFMDLGGIAALLNNDTDMQERHAQALRGVQDFEAKIKTVNEVDYRTSASSKLEALDGRLFLRAVFAALELFAEDTATLIGSGDHVNRSEYHGLKGMVFTAEEYQKTAALLVNTGVLVSQAVGTKQVLKNLPRQIVDLSDKTALHLFIETAASELRQVVHFWVSSDNVLDVAVHPADPETGTDPTISGDHEDDIMASPSTPEGSRASGSEASPDYADDEEDLAVDFAEDYDCPIHTRDQNDHNYEQLQERLAHSVKQFVATHKNNDGYSVPRCVQGVFVFYDIGYNIRPLDPESSFVTNALEAGYIHSCVMSKRRLLDSEETFSVPVLPTAALPGLPPDLAYPANDDPRVQAELERQARLFVENRNIDFFRKEDLEKSLEDMLDDIIQGLGDVDLENPEEDLPNRDAQVDYVQLLGQLRRAQAHLFSQLMSNGLFGSTHSGNKTLVVQEQELTDKLKLIIERLENVSETTGELIESYIVGMQIYMPETITLMCKKIRTVHKLLSQFPPLLMILLNQDSISQVYDYEEIWKNCQKLYYEIEQIHARFKRKTEIDVKGMSTRIEIFFQYDEKHNMSHECLANLPSFSSCIRQVNSKKLMAYLIQQSEESLAPIENLMNPPDSSNGQDTSLCNPIFRTRMTPEVKARLVYCAEQVVIFAELPYQTLPMHNESVKHLDFLTKRQGWSAPACFRTPVPAATKDLLKITYGLNKDLLKIQVQERTLPYKSGPRPRDIPSFIRNYAWALKADVRLSIHYSHTFLSIKALLLRYSKPAVLGEPISSLYDLTNQHSGTDPDDLSDYAASLVDDIDFVYLANTLTVERREQLFLKIGLLVNRLYDVNYHSLLVTKNARARKDRQTNQPEIVHRNLPFPLSTFPCTEGNFETIVSSLIEGNDPMPHLAFDETKWIINNIGEQICTVIVVPFVTNYYILTFLFSKRGLCKELFSWRQFTNRWPLDKGSYP